MTSTNRFGNRLLLLLVGLVTMAVGAWALLRAYPQWVTLPDVGVEPTPTALWIAAAGALLVIVLSLAWILTRGRGRTHQVVLDPSDDGSVEVDVRVARDLLAAALEAAHDIRSVRVAAYRVGRSPALNVTVVAEPACDLPRLRDDVATAVGQLDQALERRIPVLLHVTSGLRARRAREQRVT